jgi:hypothetical protein
MLVKSAILVFITARLDADQKRATVLSKSANRDTSFARAIQDTKRVQGSRM